MKKRSEKRKDTKLVYFTAYLEPIFVGSILHSKNDDITIRNVVDEEEGSYLHVTSSMGKGSYHRKSNIVHYGVKLNYGR